PAIDVTKSGTRREELLTTPDELSKMWVLRKFLHPMGEIEAMEFLIDKLSMTKTNAEFFDAMKRV
ncbi:MAG: transcription termination factor Rho, partial [Succinivibrio sp.]